MSNITPEIKAKFLRYEQLKLAEKDIKSQTEILKEELLPFVPEEAVIEGESGSFRRKQRDNWIYSPELEEKMAEVKAAQKEEVALGKTTGNKQTVYIEWKENKEDTSL